MSLAEKIQKDLVDAMRAKEELRLSVLRGIKAAIKHKEVEKIRVLDDAEVHSDPANARQAAQGIHRAVHERQSPGAGRKRNQRTGHPRKLSSRRRQRRRDERRHRQALAETGANSMKQMGAVVKAAKVRPRRKTRGRQSPQRPRSRTPHQAGLVLFRSGKCENQLAARFKTALLRSSLPIAR